MCLLIKIPILLGKSPVLEVLMQKRLRSEFKKTSHKKILLAPAPAISILGARPNA